ncbi:MAG: DUF1080 domain-containing protein [Acidimicrobiia bacterium]|nr:DUF1080 domain-containing protein [Acidimicrobiia bacterium]
MKRNFISLLGLTMCLSAADDWTRFRGPNGTGVSEVKGLPVEFGPGKNVAWVAELPYGSSSPVISGNNLWITASEGDQLITMCLDRTTGRVRWKRELKKARSSKIHKLNDAASPTPVTDGTNVYVFFPDLGLVSYGADGNERWRLPLGPFHNTFGMASSPVLVDGKLVLVCDQQKGSFLVAVDAATGKISWRVERPEAGISWAVPVQRANGKGETEVLVAGIRRLEGFRVSDGRRQWWHHVTTDATNGVPVLRGDTVITNAPGYDQPWLPTFAALKEKRDADKNGELTAAEMKEDDLFEQFFYYLDENHDGRITAEEYEAARTAGVGEYGLSAIRLGGEGELRKESVRWRLKRNLPYVAAPLLYHDVLYLVKNGGIITSVNPETGEILKQGRSSQAPGDYYASPVAGDGKIYALSQAGKLTVLKAGAAWEVLAVNDMQEECYATPALADGRLYVRTQSKLYAFQERVAAAEWRPLFDGTSLEGWRETPFTGRGRVHVKDGAILMEAGATMTGITWTEGFPRTHYEIRMEAARLRGGDFFASLTFPVADSFCTLVTGGWGGDIVGLSSIDGWDASDNETRTYFQFEAGRWYTLRLQVTPERIRAWIDDRQVINAPIAGRTIGLRHGEIKLSAPLGVASYQTAGAVRKLEYREMAASR